MEEFLNSTYNVFFKFQPRKTQHETLYNNGEILIPGYVPTESESVGSYYTHINYHSMKTALTKLLEYNPTGPYVFVETGCAAHGTKSTLLWDKFVTNFGGNVYSVDLDSNAVQKTQQLVSSKTTITHSDSVEYLKSFKLPIDFLYLDSYDVDYLNPFPSAKHHLKEFNAIKHLLHKGSIVLIDDTPGSPEWLDNGVHCPIYDRYKQSFDINMSGKGSLVSLELEKMGATRILHQYQVLWVV